MSRFMFIKSQIYDVISLMSIISPNLLPEHRPAADRIISQLGLCCDSIGVAMCTCPPTPLLHADIQASIMADPAALSGQQLLDEYTHYRISTISCSVMMMSIWYGESSKAACQNISSALDEAWMWLARCDRDRAWHAKEEGVFVA